MKHNKWLSILLLVLLITLFVPLPARADMAPPEQPPGTNIVPGTTPTQVRMVAETVTLTVLPKPAPNYVGQAATEAVFTMRNLGTQTETMEARFPLTFWNNESDGYSRYPEIPDIQVFVDGKKVSTHRIEADFTNSAGGVAYRQAPWAAFNVTFPPNQDVNVTIKYTSNGYGYEPDFALRYILETGAGWNDTIGSADIIVKLPYPATDENVTLNEYSLKPNSATMNGNDIRWHFEDFEPTSDHNVEIHLIGVAYWEKVLQWRQQTQKTPQDGEAWGQLGKAIKESIRQNKGYLREDAGAERLYAEAKQAYQKAVDLLPKDALWHYGFADLLWSHNFYAAEVQNQNQEIAKIADELRQSLALDPNNQDVKDLADWLGGMYPWAISKTDNGYDYPVLTATPTIDPLSVITIVPDESTSTPEPQAQPTETMLPATATDEPVSPAKTPQPGLPLCGGAAGLVLIPALAVFWRSRRR